MKIKLFFAAALLAAGLAGCKSGAAVETTDSGIQYELHANGKGTKVNMGDLVSVNYVLTLQKTTGKDTVLANTFTAGGPEKVLLKEPKKSEDIVSRTMKELLSRMNVGDSATFFIPIDSIQKDVRENNPMLKDGGKLKWDIKIADVMSKADYSKKQEEAKTRMDSAINAMVIENRTQALLDSVIITNYIKEHNLNAQRLPSGLYYVVEQEGTGPKPMPFELVSVDYKGYLTDGTPFDNSYDRGQPYTFPLGVGQVIPGWDQGLMQFKQGATGKLLVPSYLGYGKQGSGQIPANAVLIFDIHLVDIK